MSWKHATETEHGIDDRERLAMKLNELVLVSRCGTLEEVQDIACALLSITEPDSKTVTQHLSAELRDGTKIDVHTALLGKRPGGRLTGLSMRVALDGRVLSNAEMGEYRRENPAVFDAILEASRHDLRRLGIEDEMLGNAMPRYVPEGAKDVH